MLFAGCCAVSVLPPVCVWNFSIQLFGFCAANRSRMIRAHRRRAARNLATSSRKLLCALKKKLSCGAKSSTASPASIAAWTYAIPFASVNATSCTAVLPASRCDSRADRVQLEPARNTRTVRDRASTAGGRCTSARDIFLEDVVLDGPAQLDGSTPCCLPTAICIAGGSRQAR